VSRKDGLRESGGREGRTEREGELKKLRWRDGRKGMNDIANTSISDEALSRSFTKAVCLKNLANMA